jgi:hypothetical protein
MQRAPFFSWDFLCFCFSLVFCFFLHPFIELHTTSNQPLLYGLFTPCGNYWLVVVVDSPLARFDGIRISVKLKSFAGLDPGGIFSRYRFGARAKMTAK